MNGCGRKLFLEDRGLMTDGLTAFKRFLRDEDGATAIEYGLIVSLIFLAIMGAVKSFSAANNAMYSDISSALVN